MDPRLDGGRQTSLVSVANLMSAKDVREKPRHGLDGRRPEGNSASRLAISDSKNPFLRLVVPEASRVREDKCSESPSARAPVRVLTVASGNDTTFDRKTSNQNIRSASTPRATASQPATANPPVSMGANGLQLGSKDAAATSAVTGPHCGGGPHIDVPPSACQRVTSPVTGPYWRVVSTPSQHATSSVTGPHCGGGLERVDPPHPYQDSPSPVTGPHWGRTSAASAPQVKLGSYDGSTPYEEFRLKFDLVAGMNGWTPRTKLCQLMVALEGDAKQVLNAMGPIASVDVLHQALSRRFGDTTPPLSDRQQFHQRVRQPEEPLGVFMRDLRRLTQCSYPSYSMEARDALVLDAFIRGMTPESLQQQLFPMQFSTTVEALQYALTIGNTLKEQPVPSAATSLSSQPCSCAVFLGDSSQLRPAHRPTPGPQGAAVCWRCGERGHIRRHCTVLDSEIVSQQQVLSVQGSSELTSPVPDAHRGERSHDQPLRRQRPCTAATTFPVLTASPPVPDDHRGERGRQPHASPVPDDHRGERGRQSRAPWKCRAAALPVPDAHRGEGHRDHPSPTTATYPGGNHLALGGAEHAAPGHGWGPPGTSRQRKRRPRRRRRAAAATTPGSSTSPPVPDAHRGERRRDPLLPRQRPRTAVATLPGSRTSPPVLDDHRGERGRRPRARWGCRAAALPVPDAHQGERTPCCCHHHWSCHGPCIAAAMSRRHQRTRRERHPLHRRQEFTLPRGRGT